MTANSLGATPFTPYPDPPSQSGDESAPPPLVPGRAGSEERRQSESPVPSSSDDLNLLLTQSSPDPFLEVAAEEKPRTSSPARSPVGEVPAAEAPGLDSSASFLDATPGPAQPRPAIDGSEPLSLSALHSSSENDLDLDIRFSPSPDAQVRPASPAQSVHPSKIAEQEAKDEDEPRINWPLLLTASYASAVTLALAWLLWSGRGLARRVSFTAPASAPPAAASLEDQPRDGKPAEAVDSPPPLPTPNMTELGKTIRLGDLEVTPRSITHRQVELSRLEGTTGEQRESPDSLVLTLELSNRSTGITLTPLDPAFVRESSTAIDHSYIETPGGRRIAMFRLAAESEWSLQDQVFPTLKPGESAETIIVSEPVPYDLPKGSLTWHVKLRTRTYQTDVLGIRFMATDVNDWR
jgi:hypothetical protein